MFKFMNLGVVNRTTFYQLLKTAVTPVIMEEKEERLKRNCQDAGENQTEGVVVAGKFVKN